jgi:SAM-dependent methyltransferase
MKIIKIYIPYRRWFVRKINLRNKDVADFGAGTNSDFYKICQRQKAHYLGFDINEESVSWLKKHKLWLDFWHTKNKFDIVNASQVYEHLNTAERKRFCAKAYKLLKPSGILLIDFPYMENLNGLKFWRDLTHKPVSVRDDKEIIYDAGFKFNAVFLAGISTYNPLFNLASLILFGSYQQTIQIIATKK